ncbi:MAG: hypothetical protein ABIK73_06650 [candidate division WOR-3 bacterium]
MEGQKKVRGRPFQKGYDPRRNLNGRGHTRDFLTSYHLALRKIAENVASTEEDVELKIIEVAIAKALAGNFYFYRDLMDRVFGKATDTIQVRAELEGERKPDLEMVGWFLERMPERERLRVIREFVKWRYKDRV